MVYVMPMTKLRPSDERRIIVPMKRQLIETIDDFRFSHRKSSRAVAIRDLIALGLDAAKQLNADPEKGSKS